jgi:hypothetical protein
MRWTLAVAALGMLVSCGIFGPDGKLEKWNIPTANADKLLDDVATRATYYKERIAELDANKDGQLDIWELLRGLSILADKFGKD